MVNGLIRCSENCKYQENGECALDNVPKYCLQLNSKKACIYYKKRDEAKAEKNEKSNFEVFY